MSSAQNGERVRREVAYRLFGIEYEGANREYSDSDEERAPNYVVTPTGARVNRLFVVGVLTEVEPVSDDVLRARVVDPTGAFVAYAGQYQPEAVAFLEEADVPSFVSVTGKARTFQPDGSDRVFTSLRPESITAADADTRDRWTVQAAEHTLARIATMAQALEREERGESLQASLQEAGVDSSLASGIPLAIDHYGTSPAYLSALREQAIAATEVIAGIREAVPDFDLAPDDDGPVADDLTVAPGVAGTLAAGGELSQPSAADDGLPGDGQAEASSPESAPTAETEPSPTAADPDDSTELEPSDDTVVGAAGPDDDLGGFEGSVSGDENHGQPGEQYELDADEREEVEEEFGTEFSTGSEVGEPGEAGIDAETAPPSTDAADGAESQAAPEESSEGEPASDPSATPGSMSAETGQSPEAEDDGPASEPDTDVDLEDVVVEVMAELDDGDGADRQTVVDAVVDAHDVDVEAVEDAIDDALMGGRCYEPADGTLKSI